ncbi:MAG: PDZ domain-containing protein [Planctomycetaceae bacterium]|nr:PDZ domain-containing protein [Planctomycetaceae bacterium]
MTSALPQSVILFRFTLSITLLGCSAWFSQCSWAEESLDMTLSRHGVALKSAFRDVVAEVSHYTIEVEINETTLVPGTLLDPARGICVTKASSLGEVAEEDDLFRCHLAGDRWVGCDFVGYSKEHDLVFLKCPPATTRALPAVKPASEAKPGQWIISLEYGSELPAGVGVIGATPRQIPETEGFVGLVVDQSDEGLKVSSVQANSGAARAGLKAGDVILDEQKKPLDKRNSLASFLAEFQPGDWFVLQALRDGEPVLFNVRVGTSWDSVIDRQAMMNRFGSDVSERRSGFPSALQHDTLLHPRHCGGPLVNIEGELIGINIARAGRTDTLAIPYAELLKVLKEVSR